MILSDNELIAKTIAQKDKHAFGQLVNRYQSDTRSLFRRLTKGNTLLSDDLAQETFLSAYEKLNTFQGKSKFSTWLYRIAYNKYLEEIRKPKNKIMEVEIEPERMGNISSHENSNIKLDLEKAFLHLSDMEKLALTLTFNLGLTNNEISDVMGLPLGTVKSHILRGKEKLKTLLEPWRRKSA